MSGKRIHSSFVTTGRITKYSNAGRVLRIAIIVCCGLFLMTGSLRGQQGLKEYIYMNGKAVAVETRAITPPTATISSPTSGTAYITSASSITLAGTASDNVGVTQVTWKNNRGGSGTCSGTTSWTCSGIALQSGQNVLTVVAHDAENSTGGDALTVTREEPCTYQLYPSPYEALYAPVEGSSNLEGYVTTGSGCTWEATSNDGWIQIAPASETGSGMFFINVDPNIFFYPRSGSITVAGNTYTIYQSGYY